MKDDAVYRKVGNRYKKVGYEFRGFPMDGIWLVKDGRNNQICLISEEENPPIFALPYRTYTEELCKHLMKLSGKSHSWMDISRWACDFFAHKYRDKKEKS